MLLTEWEGLVGIDTCAVSDSLDHFGLIGATAGLRPLWPNRTVVIGRARTVQAGVRSPESPTTHIASPAVESAQAGDFIVIANDGRTDVSCWGGILTHAALMNGIVGVAIDGACRDIKEGQELGLPIYGRAVVPISARGRIVQLDMDVPVTVAGVSVSPNDFVIADDCGVVFVPSAHVDAVIELTREILEREQRMVSSVRNGRSVIETMRDSRFVIAPQELP
jgi:regulator of RNase E activity RraA